MPRSLSASAANRWRTKGPASTSTARTKTALAVAKARGVVLGGPKLARPRQRAAATNKALADAYAAIVLPSSGGGYGEPAPTSLHQIANALKAREITAPRGGQWYAKSVSNERSSLAAAWSPVSRYCRARPHGYTFTPRIAIRCQRIADQNPEPDVLLRLFPVLDETPLRVFSLTCLNKEYINIPIYAAKALSIKVRNVRN
jgi:hypothetical protein